MRTVLATLHSKFIHASLALPCLAAYAANDGDCGEVRLREFTVHEPKEQVLAALLAEEPQVIAFSVYLWNRRQTLELADALAIARPGLRVVLGGPEVSFDGPELFAAHPGISALVHGEGEIPLRGLLAAWGREEEPFGVPRLTWRTADGLARGPEAPPLADLDEIPSPFSLGLADLSRGVVYLETSRGCPYACAFCMSALDERVRSFSLARIEADLGLLMARGVPKIKLVDRTFNYDAGRARQIWKFILERNQGSSFHFEIGAHLLTDDDLRLLETVPPGMFRFEIGVQSTLPETLAAIGRHAPLQRLEENVRRLRTAGNIHLHLDLIAGLPGEGYRDFLASVDRVAALGPDHLQIEPVKLLPGSPLRGEAAALGIRFDPHPPYTVLATPQLTFAELQRLAGISRLLDLTLNSGRGAGFLAGLAAVCGSLTVGLERLEAYFRLTGKFRQPLSLRGIFESLGEFVREGFADERREGLRELLARDYARSERLTPDAATSFFDLQLTPEEAQAVKLRVGAETARRKGEGVKIQHLAAAFSRLPDHPGRTVLLFFYLTRTGEGLEIQEIPLSPPA